MREELKTQTEQFKENVKKQRGEWEVSYPRSIDLTRSRRRSALSLRMSQTMTTRW